jgi:Mpv17 / PMP22 family
MYIPTLKANFIVWPAVQIVNFRLMPVQFQLVRATFSSSTCVLFSLTLPVALCLDCRYRLDCLSVSHQQLGLSMSTNGSLRTLVLEEGLWLPTSSHFSALFSTVSSFTAYLHLLGRNEEIVTSIGLGMDGNTRDLPMRWVYNVMGVLLSLVLRSSLFGVRRLFAKICVVLVASFIDFR